MDLSKIVSISGKPGLYAIKSQAVGRLIVESVIDGKCTPAFARDRMSSLEEISIFLKRFPFSPPMRTVR